MKKSSLDVIRGTLDVLILRALSWGPQHGYAVSQWIREQTSDELLVEEGALYPALYRMETKGWIASEWGASENNRRAKYYTLTPEGRRMWVTTLISMISITRSPLLERAARGRSTS
jgi:PadR family transcriptional regulator, regulatory protein PadR